MTNLYSALYYPHTSIQDLNLLRTSLLLWDSVTTIVPWEGFQPDYETPPERRAWELIGRGHFPAPGEQKAVHQVIEEFAKDQVNPNFLYPPQGLAPSQVYEIYPQKLLPETVEFLRSKGLMGQFLQNSDLTSTQFMGLHLMNILGDCCAGDQVARITDEQPAYEALAGLLTERTSDAAGDSTREAVVQVTLDVLDLADVELESLIAFRVREAREARGNDYRQLRHRYCDRVEEQVKSLQSSKGTAERQAIREQFREDMKEDIRLLRQELGSNTFQTRLSYTGIASTVLVLACEAAAHFGFVPSLGSPLTTASISTATSAATGLLVLGSKFAQSRAEVLRKHPLSYLYSLKQ